MKQLLLVLALSLLAPPAGAGIAYTALRDGIWQIYWQAGWRTSPRPVGVKLGVDASAPSLSPDGSRVAFEVPGQGIFVCPLAHGGHCRTVATDIGSAVRPVWDPRSGELVFVRYLADAGGEDSEILITRGGLEKVGPLVTHTGNQDDPDVSPDGRWLAYSSAQVVSLHQAGVRVVRQLWLMDLATGGSHPLVPGAHQDMHPDFSPDGSRIAFASDRDGELEIWVVGREGEELRRVTSGPGSKTWPVWSPNGQSILYARAFDGRQELWTVRVDGSDPERFEPFGAGSDVELRDPDWR